MVDLIVRKVYTIIKRNKFLFEICKVILGYTSYRFFKILYHGNTLCLIRGATGDTYIQLLLLPYYAKQFQLNKYYAIGDGSGLEELSKLFGMKNVRQIPPWLAVAIEKVYMCLGKERISLIIPFRWSDGFEINRCRVRLSQKFNFMDTYFHFSFGMKPIIKPLTIKYSINNKLTKKCDEFPVLKGRTVILSPDANSVTPLDDAFWNNIINELRNRGYLVYVNCNDSCRFNTPNVFFGYEDFISLIEYAGCFIGIRSGLCDIISSAKCKKIIIYPEAIHIDLDHHRSDYNYSSLSVMGLSGDENLYEISTPLIYNITDINRDQDNSLRAEFYKILKEQIILAFEKGVMQC